MYGVRIGPTVFFLVRSSGQAEEILQAGPTKIRATGWRGLPDDPHHPWSHQRLGLSLRPVHEMYIKTRVECAVDNWSIGPLPGPSKKLPMATCKRRHKILLYAPFGWDKIRIRWSTNGG